MRRTIDRIQGIGTASDEHALSLLLARSGRPDSDVSIAPVIVSGGVCAFIHGIGVEDGRRVLPSATSSSYYILRGIILLLMGLELGDRMI